jgi:hypothetical protein
MREIGKIYRNKKIYYKGYLKNNKKNGNGIIFNSKGSKIYQGQWKNDKKEGFGIEYVNNLIRYRGYWKNDKKSGEGILYDENKCISYKGNWKNNLFNGYGNQYLKGVKVYEGNFLNGKRHGKGVRFIFNMFYENEWTNGIEKKLKTLPKKFISDGFIGKGGFGTVRLYKNKENNKSYVWKTIKNENYARLQYHNLKFLKEKNICKEYFICPYGIYRSGKEYIILFDSLKEYKELNELYNSPVSLESKKIICRKLIKELKILHHYGIIHGDIKSRNIMVDLKTLDVRIIDFGISIVTDKSKSFLKYRAFGYTKKYITLSSKKKYNFDEWSKNDFNALYMVMYHLLTNNKKTNKSIKEIKTFVNSILYK